MLDLCRRVAASTVVFEADPLGRVFRDLRTATQNAVLAPDFCQRAGASSSKLTPAGAPRWLTRRRSG